MICKMGKKGQFFIISVVAIIIIFVSLSKVLSVEKTRFVEIRDIGFVFRNLKSELIGVVTSSLQKDPTGASLESDLESAVPPLKNEIKGLGYGLDLDYSVSGSTVNFEIELVSSMAKISDLFSV